MRCKSQGGLFAAHPKPPEAAKDRHRFAQLARSLRHGRRIIHWGDVDMHTGCVSGGGVVCGHRIPIQLVVRYVQALQAGAVNELLRAHRSHASQ